MSAIACQNLSKRYGAVHAIKDLSLTVPEGSIFGFLGPNGAGKTTTVRMLVGLSRPSAGSALVGGIDAVANPTQLPSVIGYLEQQPQFYSWMTGRELLTLVGKLFGISGQPLKRRIDELLEQTGITHAANRKVGGYSGGMRQRLGLAQALLHKPKVLFLDEPVSALDPGGRRDVLELIGALRGQTTVFMSTHILGDVERVCDRVAILDHGRLITEATVSELQERYAQPIFVLDPEPNQEAALPGLMARIEDQPWAEAVQHEHGQILVHSNDPAATSAALLHIVADADVRLMRYERMRPDLENIFLRVIQDQGAPIAQEVLL